MTQGFNDPVKLQCFDEIEEIYLKKYLNGDLVIQRNIQAFINAFKNRAVEGDPTIWDRKRKKVMKDYNLTIEILSRLEIENVFLEDDEFNVRLEQEGLPLRVYNGEWKLLNKKEDCTTNVRESIHEIVQRNDREGTASR